MRNILIICLAIIIVSCAPKSDLEELDLMSTGLPIKIKSPAESVVKIDDIGGLFKDVTVKGDEGFYLQITSSEALTSDISLRIAEEKRTVENLNNFSKIISENKSGFIFEKMKDENPAYDFRHIRIQGDQEYLFQTGLIGHFKLEDVEKMYDAVQ